MSNGAIYRLRTEREVSGELLAARKHYDVVLKLACDFRDCELPPIVVIDGVANFDRKPLPDDLQTELTRAASEVARLQHELYSR